ncbi:transmembrane protein 272-like [Branchiostoma floridae]|uniref:Transmembrane protein 272-like n=1 Tax=Branchiostoma floridae TaxID=7739 RepID=A0A9J7LUC1_BRAFL|nr:transmembrane protein 272-like [Branchiostoma floridae]
MATEKDVESGEGGVPLSDLPTTTTEEPPKYTPTENTAGDAPPPSYASILEQIKAAREESDGNVEFGKKASTAVAGSKGCTVCGALLMVVPVAMIAVGALSVHKQDCPIQRMIPIYLLVFGCFYLVKSLISLAERCRNHRDNESEKNAKPNPVEGVLTCFLFGWFIAGNYWIYSVYTTVNLTDPTSAMYCQPSMYQFAFWVTTIVYIMAALCVLFFCCGCFAICCCAKGKGSKDEYTVS